MEWVTAGGQGDERLIARAADVLRAGGIVVYPTDTLYGLAADPRIASAVERIFAVKGRPGGQPLPLIAGSLGQADGQVARFSILARTLAERFWPGPLTLVADARPALAPGVAGEDGSVAVRVPDHRIARALAEALGFAVVSTSANLSGQPAAATAAEAAANLADLVDLVIDAGRTPGGPPSTIVDTRSDPPRLVRPGAVPFHVVLEALTHP